VDGDGGQLSSALLSSIPVLVATRLPVSRGFAVFSRQNSTVGGSGFVFTQDITVFGDFTLFDQTTARFWGVPIGSYIVTENDPSPAYDLTDIICDDGGSATPSTGGLATRTATVNLDSGETVRCVFTNTATNRAPVANDDSYSTDEDTALHEATPGVLGNGVLVNDTDADGDPLTAVLDTNPSHGSLTAFNSDGAFTYQPDQNYCGPDSFTDHANDGQADSNLATVDFEVVCIDDPPRVSVDTSSQTVQYSDYIAPVIVTATDMDSSSLSLSHDAPSPLSTSGSCTPSGDGTSCTWALAGRVLVSAGTYDVNFTISDGTTGVLAGTQIVVDEEDATLAFDDNNPVAVPVDDSGTSEPFRLRVHVQEASESVAAAAPGDINLAGVSIELVPVGPGSPATVVCASTGAVADYDYDAILIVSCDFSGIPVNTYTAAGTVTGGYYTGAGEDVLVVYDPDPPSTTGGGWFNWPDTGDRTNFGYTMKYNNKGTRVQGSLLLIRHLPDGSKYRIKSNALYGLALGEASGTGSHGWASFSGKATYLAPGTSDAEGNHEVTAYVEDRSEPGAGADRFWLQVRDKDGKVIAELSLSPDADTNAITISGGNIVVPHGAGG
jgi:hypothetical protein